MKIWSWALMLLIEVSTTVSYCFLFNVYLFQTAVMLY